MSTILTNIKAFTAAELLRSRKATERSGSANAGSFSGAGSFWGLMAGWFSVLFGNGMDMGAFREVCSKGSKIRIMAEDSMQPDFQ